MRRFLAGYALGILVAVAALLAHRHAGTAQTAGLAAFVTSGRAVPGAVGAPMSVLGHLRYPVADPATLVPVDAAGQILLRRSAAQAFLALQAAAARDGVRLVAVSGFRDLARQDRLFFGEAAARGETVRERAFTCAPPGFSEHHTGYSLDVGDAEHRDAQLELRFRDTPGFAWMAAHAASFHFELSFPSHNPQHVMYEPWHWRFVGDPDSFKTFYWARAGKP